jgi:ketosteroid isomerase-like protein
MRHILTCLVSLLITAPALGQLPTSHRAVEASLDSLMRAYAKAFEARDAERVIAFYAPGAQTFGWSDGQALSYEPYVAALRGFLRTSHDISIVYENVKAHAITDDIGAVRTTLRESWRDSTGKLMTFRVLASWVARRNTGQWQLVYFDGRHVAVPSDSVRKP